METPPADYEGASGSRRKSEPPLHQIERRTQESWEYPMSKEEKKDRVIFLFEQELSEARQNEEEQALDELVSQLERIEELRPGTAKRLKAAVRSIGLLEVTSGSKWRSLRSRLGTAELGWLLAGLSLLVLILSVFVHRSWLSGGAPPGLESGLNEGVAPAAPVMLHAVPNVSLDLRVPSPGNVSSDAAPHISGGLSTTTTTTTTTAGTATTAAPATTAPAAPATVDTKTLDTVLRWRSLGNDCLKRSDCVQAAQWFNVSRAQLLHMEANDPQEILSLHFSLQVDHAFALICSQRFPEGVELLQECVSGALKCSSYLLNAMGYAFHKMQDFETAAKVFQKSLTEDAENPIIWNNLGAAQMELGHLQEADLALEKADELAVRSGEAHPRQLVIANVQELAQRAKTGKAQQKSVVDIWYKEERKESRSKEL